MFDQASCCQCVSRSLHYVRKTLMHTRKRFKQTVNFTDDKVHRAGNQELAANGTALHKEKVKICRPNGK